MMTSYLTIRTASDASPRRVVPQDFARLFAEKETRTETRAERIANATLGILFPLRVALLAFRRRAAKHRRLTPRIAIRALSV